MPFEILRVRWRRSGPIAVRTKLVFPTICRRAHPKRNRQAGHQNQFSRAFTRASGYRHPFAADRTSTGVCRTVARGQDCRNDPCSDANNSDFR